MSRSSLFGGAGRALSNVNFRRYWLGMSVSTAGFWGYRVAIGWLVWELTYSTFWLGLVVFAEMVPMIILGPLGGVVVDRHGALRVSRLAQTGWGLAIGLLAALTLLDLVDKETLLALAVLQGCVSGFSNASHLALVAKLVGPEDLAAAVALQAGTVQTGRFIGPALIGPLLIALGAGWVFALVACGYFFFVAMLLSIRTVEVERPGQTSGGFLADFSDGLRYAWGHYAIFNIILFTTFAAILLRPVIDLMPGFTDQVFGRGAQGLAWLLAAFGAGSTISALWIAYRGSTRGMTGIFAATLLIGSLALLGFGLNSDFRGGLALAALFGFATNTVSICSQTLVQHMVAGHMRARVMGLLGMTFRTIPAGGALILGWAATDLGLPTVVVISAGLCILAWLRLTQIRRRREILQAPDRGGSAISEDRPIKS